jgi:uncharacterized protein
MKQYLIFANDATDEKALERRMEVRPRHFEYIKKMKASGNFVIGGAQLSEEETMNGSAIILQFETESDLQQYLANEPYILEGVWGEYKVIPFKVATV